MQQKDVKTVRDLTVLVVTGEQGLCEVISDDLRFAGYNAVWTCSKGEPERILANEGVDAVVTSIYPPHIGGLPLLETVKFQEPDMPCILLNSGVDEFAADDAYNQGADGILPVPFSHDVLLEMLRVALLAKERKWTRQFERRDNINISAELDFERLDESGTSTLLSIGRGGAFVASESDNRRVGEVVKFKFSIDTHPVSGTGVIRWIRNDAEEGKPRGFGVEFQVLDDEAVVHVMGLVERSRVRAYIPKGLKTETK